MKKEAKSSWGGAREGSGRKPRLQHEAREIFNATVDVYAERLTKLAIYHAGHGDKDMLRYLLDQRIGKASQNTDVTTMGQPITAPPPDDNATDILAIAELGSDPT